MTSKLPPFRIERYFAQYEFNVPHLLCTSECQPLTKKELLEMADEETKEIWENMSFAYTDSAGLPLLREEIVKIMYPSLTVNNILVLVPEEGIYLSMQTILQPNDHAIVVSPAYQSLYSVAESLGCEISLWEAKERENDPMCSLYFDVHDLERLVRPNTTLLIINFPHNPTGYLPTHEEFDLIIQFCKKYDLFLFSDEMYRYLEPRADLCLPPACEVYDKAICLSGMSKAFGLPGLRIGWIATKQESFYRRLAELKDYTTICNSAPSEILALMALRAKDQIVSRNLRIIEEGITAAEKILKPYSHLILFSRPIAGPISYPKFICNNVSVNAFCEKLVHDAGILLLPSTTYNEQDKTRFRLSFGHSEIPKRLELLEAFLKAFDHEQSLKE